MRVEDVARKRRKTLAIRSEHAPVLAAEDFPFPFLHIDKDVPHPECVRVARHENIGRLISQKVSFEVTKNLRAGNGGIDTETDSRVLSGKIVFADVAGGAVVIGNASKVRSDTAAHIGGPSEPGEINKSERRECRVADADPERRGISRLKILAASAKQDAASRSLDSPPARKETGAEPAELAFTSGRSLARWLRSNRFRRGHSLLEQLLLLFHGLLQLLDLLRLLSDALFQNLQFICLPSKKSAGSGDRKALPDRIFAPLVVQH